ncbi:MAG: hypothetical protein ACOC12_01490 [Bacteroidota bacterium]
MRKKLVITMVLYLIVSPVLLYSQQGHSYREYSRDICISTERHYNRIPEEILFQVEVKDHMFYLVFNDEEWFDDFFSEERRQLGVKMVRKEFFACHEAALTDPDKYFYYLEPVSYQDMKKSRFTNADGIFLVPLGAAPVTFIQSEYDHGIIISRKNRPCVEHWYTRRPVHDWELLQQALIVDSLFFPADTMVKQRHSEPVHMDFTFSLDILFPKNELTFNRDTLRKFIYSLPLQAKEVEKISISAFASIEGPENRNKELYENRAKVIYDELSVMIPDTGQYYITVDENWEAFYNDIAQSTFHELKEKNHEEIRLLLRDEKTSRELESILRNHRKARVTVIMNQSIDPVSSSLDELWDFFSLTLYDEDTRNALIIQDAIFRHLEGVPLAGAFPDSLPIPDSKHFSFVFNRDHVFRYHKGYTNLHEAHSLFEKLADHFPDDGAIRFNITELLFRKWLEDPGQVDEKELLEKINALPDYQVPANAYNRLKLNYHLVKLNQSMDERDRRQRNRSIRAIRNLYPSTRLNETELLSMAGFFAAYKQNVLAERLLRPYVRVELPDEDILFYYFKLTVAEESIMNMRWYDDLLHKALEVNPVRFCALFQPVSRKDASGLSLLFRENFRTLYCVHCNHGK